MEVKKIQDISFDISKGEKVCISDPDQAKAL